MGGFRISSSLLSTPDAVPLGQEYRHLAWTRRHVVTASGFGKRAGLPGWAGLGWCAGCCCCCCCCVCRRCLLARRWSLPFFLRFGDRFAFSHGDPQQKRRSDMMSFHKSVPLSFSSAHSFCP